MANSGIPAGRAALQSALALITLHGRIAAVEESAARQAGLQCPTFPDPAALARNSDLLMVFGGDGTILRAVRAPSLWPLAGARASRSNPPRSTMSSSATALFPV